MEHTKRYMVIVKTIFGKERDNYRNDTPYKQINQIDKEEFNTLSEANSFINDYIELYKNTPKPKFIQSHYINKHTSEVRRYYPYNQTPADWKHIDDHIDYSNGAVFWGYIIADFTEERVIKAGGDKGVFNNILDVDNNTSLWYDNMRTSARMKPVDSPTTSLAFKDYLFRGKDEIPKNYVWDGIEEYKGWLQYRWGNGKNAITYIETPKKKIAESEEASEDDLKKYLLNYDDSSSDYYDDADK